VNRGSARAAAAVAVLVVALVTAACGIPTGGGPTAIAKSDVPFQLLNPTPAGTVTSTLPPSVAVPEQIYLVAPSQSLIAVARDVEIPATPSEVLGALLEGPTPTESAAGLETYLAGTRTQVTATVAAGIATVNFSVNPVQVVGPTIETIAIAQVVYTATEQPGVTGVSFEIAGQPIDVPTDSGADVAGPVDRTAYLAQAPAP